MGRPARNRSGVQGRTWSDAPLDVFVAKSADPVTCSRRAKRAGEHVVAGRSPFPLPRVSPRRFGTVLRPRWEGGTFVPWGVTPRRLRSDHDDRLARRHAPRRLAQRSPGGPSVYDMVLTEHRVVEAEVDTLFATARDFDFLTVRSPLVTAMMTARALPSRLRGKATDAPTRLAPGLRTWGVAGLADPGSGSGP